MNLSFKNKHMTFAQNFQKNLLSWFEKNKRDLPFRQTKTPYHVWLSEIMAQQTTMTAVLPYFERFLQRFPTIESVSTAKESDLLNVWQGLGYYSRVRNFQKACQIVMRDHHGEVPQSFEELLKLPGIGEYTAAAISSICFGEKKAVLDGNVKRVLARVFWFDEPIQTQAATVFFKSKLEELLAQNKPGTFNEAMMELGALVCRPKSPTCLLCPLQKLCVGSQKNPESVPLKKKQNFQEVTYFSLLAIQNEKILLKKPSVKNLIKNMWELPSVYDEASPLKKWQADFGKNVSEKKLTRLGEVKHGIMNRKITTEIFEAAGLGLENHSEYEFVPLKKLQGIPLNTLSQKVLKKFGVAF